MAERPEDLNLPTPIVSKLIKDCLPSNCKVTDEAKVAITKVKLIKFIQFLIKMHFRPPVCLSCTPPRRPTQWPQIRAERQFLGVM